MNKKPENHQLASQPLSSPNTGGSDRGSTEDPAPPPPLRGLERLYTLAEVSEATQLSASTLRRAIRHRQLGAIRVGAAIRISQTDLEAWLGRNRRKPR